MSRDERRERGKAERKRVPRRELAGFVTPPDRPDPLALVEDQNRSRLPEIVPVRWGRMAQSPFGWLRGSPVVMTADLAGAPATSLTVQLCGDAHLLNFGLFAAPDRRQVFDVNDFDETLAGPFEWDVKRLATSAVVAAATAGFPDDVADRAADGGRRQLPRPHGGVRGDVGARPLVRPDRRRRGRGRGPSRAAPDAPAEGGAGAGADVALGPPQAGRGHAQRPAHP